MSNKIEQTSGFLVINKEKGPTSHGAINSLRRITGIKKIGHAGTLDPLAKGVLLMAVGRDATKKINSYISKEKEYEAVFKLGVVTETHDGEKEEHDYLPTWHRFLPQKFSFWLKKRNLANISEIRIEKVLSSFWGKQKQLPPMYSAKKVNGKRLYQLARQGAKIKRSTHIITISNIELMDFSWPFLTVRIECSSGTYIRSLARDIGRKLGCGAYMSDLTRTRVGEFNIEESIKLRELYKENWKDFLKKCE